jgi:hypothetical protein
MANKLELLTALSEPAPGSEEYTIEGTDIALTIQGIPDRYTRETKVSAQAKALIKARSILLDDGRRVSMTDTELIAACFCAACVVDPEMNAYRWAVWGYANPKRLEDIRDRCLIVSRLIDDPATGQLSGVDEAVDEFTGGVARLVDPLVPSSGDSVPKSTADSRTSLSDESPAEPASDVTPSTEEV